MSQKPPSGSLIRRAFRYIPKNSKDLEQKKIPVFFAFLSIAVLGVILWNIISTAYQYASTFQLRDIVDIMASELQKDSRGQVNVLFLGNGGGTHEGPDLTDTIMLASLNADQKTVALLSIPRDLWVDIPDSISSRINKIYEILKPQYDSMTALTMLRGVVERITGVSIPYVVKVDFEFFEKTIDLLGGIDLMVEKSIYDTEYPNETETGYETFQLDAGLQRLDGKTALKYVRSRHSTNDFDRSKRQHEVIRAIKEKAEQMSLLSSPLRLKQLLQQFSQNIETNMRFGELLALASFSQDISQSSITTGVLKDIDVIEMGSFLYPPPREDYGGAAVLMPIGKNYASIQRFVSLLFEIPEFFKEKASIEILNGTKHLGLAANVGNKLISYGFRIQRYGNLPRKKGAAISKTYFTINHSDRAVFTEKALTYLFPEFMKTRNTADESNQYDITLVVGDDVNLEKF